MDQRICKQRRARARHPVQRRERIMIEMNGRVLLQTSAELVRTYSAIADAITATVLNAQAGLAWLNAQPPDLEEIRRSLNSIANDGKRAGEFIVRVRALMKKGLTVDGAPDPVSNAAQARSNRGADEMRGKPNAF
jgi:hypothetical protein